MLKSEMQIFRNKKCMCMWQEGIYRYSTHTVDWVLNVHVYNSNRPAGLTCDTKNREKLWLCKMLVEKWNENKFACGILNERKASDVSLHLLHSSATHFHLIGNIISTSQQLKVPLEIKEAAAFKQRLSWEKFLLHVSYFELGFFFLLLSLRHVSELSNRLHDWHILMQVLFVDLINAMRFSFHRFFRVSQLPLKIYWM